MNGSITSVFSHATGAQGNGERTSVRGRDQNYGSVLFKTFDLQHGRAAVRIEGFKS